MHHNHRRGYVASYHGCQRYYGTLNSKLITFFQRLYWKKSRQQVRRQLFSENYDDTAQQKVFKTIRYDLW